MCLCARTCVCLCECMRVCVCVSSTDLKRFLFLFSNSKKNKKPIPVTSLAKICFSAQRFMTANCYLPICSAADELQHRAVCQAVTGGSICIDMAKKTRFAAAVIMLGGYFIILLLIFNFPENNMNPLPKHVLIPLERRAHVQHIGYTHSGRVLLNVLVAFKKRLMVPLRTVFW